MHIQSRWSIVALALVLAAAPRQAGALAVSGITVAPTGANTADVLANGGANRRQVSSSATLLGAAPAPVADVVGASVAFGTRYAQLVAADREAGGGATSQSATAAYSITFTVVNPLGGLYRVDVDTSRLGALTLINDGGGGASASLGAVSGLLDGVGNGALGLPAVATLTGVGGGNQGFSQIGSTLSLTDTATSRTFTLAFSWAASASSSRDEAAVRLGVGGGLTSTTADDYPGLGARVASGDGHFVNVGVTLLAVPEPATFALLGGGIAVLAGGRRRRALARS